MQQLQLFEHRLPHRPYAADQLPGGVYKMPRIEAMKRKYIQPNHDTYKAWLVVDCDRPGAAHDWHLRECPAPNIVAESPKSLRAHLFYALEWPVHVAPESSLKALRYAAAVEHALVTKLGGDYGYAGLLAKNPMSDAWRVWEPQPFLYTLDWLSEFLDLQSYADRRRRLPDYGLGRNCTLFNRVRSWAYRERLRVDWPDLGAWRMACLQRAAYCNDFACPLPIAELKSTAKSVSAWTWTHITAEGFSRIQRARAMRRWGTTRKDRQNLLLDFTGSIREIAEASGVPRSTVHRLRAEIPQIPDMALGHPLEIAR